MDFKNSVVAVTGGASGLGEATVKNIVAHGGKALMMDVNDEKGTQLAEALGDQVLYVNTNVVEEADVRSALD
ncbi:SDR family NAD(P)-dependent oxidoreductase, partial [Brevibacillus porteri]